MFLNFLVKLLFKPFLFNIVFNLFTILVDGIEKWAWQIFEWALNHLGAFSLSLMSIEFIFALELDFPLDLGF